MYFISAGLAEAGFFRLLTFLLPAAILASGLIHAKLTNWRNNYKRPESTDLANTELFDALPKFPT